ncbi:hypothetical protein [Streptomyces siamensis]
MPEFAGLVPVGGPALSGWQSNAGCAAVACIGVLMALRMWTPAPALHRWSSDSAGRKDDGSYNSVNRGDKLP